MDHGRRGRDQGILERTDQIGSRVHGRFAGADEARVGLEGLCGSKQDRRQRGEKNVGGHFHGLTLHSGIAPGNLAFASAAGILVDIRSLIGGDKDDGKPQIVRFPGNPASLFEVLDK